MTKWNHSIDNPSPLLSYTAPSQWFIPTNLTDPLVANYGNDSTATATNAVGATVTFSFTGTGIWVYGAKRATHGFYNVTIDNHTHTYDGLDTNNVFGQVLFGKSDLKLGQYTLSIANAGPLSDDPANANLTGFDIDWLVWETEYDGPGGPVNAQVTELTFDNEHPRFQFLPSSAWNDATSTKGYANGTAEVTNQANAQVKFTFDGDAIALYGAVDPSHGSYSASVDGAQSVTLSGNSNVTAYQQMLYYAEDLGAGTHNLIVENQPTSSSRDYLSVDFVKTWTARGGSGGSDQTAPQKSDSVKPGPIAGGVVGGVLFLGGVAFLVVYFLRRRRKQRLREASRYPNSTFSASSDNPRSPFGEEYAVPYSASRDDMSAKSVGLNSAQTHQTHQSTPSMGSISSTITDSSTQQLVRDSAYADDPIPMSRFPSTSRHNHVSATSPATPTPASASTSQYPSATLLHPTQRYSSNAMADPFAPNRT